MEGTENEVAGDEEYEELLVIDAASDCEGVKVVGDEEDSGHDTGSGTSVRIFPKSETVVSTITDQSNFRASLVQSRTFLKNINMGKPSSNVLGKWP